MFTKKLIPALLLTIALSFISACGSDDAQTPTSQSAVPAAETAPAVTEAAPAVPEPEAETIVAAPVETPPTPETTSAAVTPEPAISQPAETTPEPVAEVPVAAEPPVAETPAAATPAPQPAGAAQTHTINAEARIFKPEIVYIQPGDTVGWINMTSHNNVSVDGLIPAGATPWRGQLGENLKVTLNVEGIYAYVCEPHIGFGMTGVIVVGKPTNLEEVKATADKTLQGPFRRILGKLNKVVIP